MKKESRKKYLLKNTIFFSIGNFGSKIINFFLVPLYTNILSVAEYGTVDLMTILTTVLVPIITLNLSEAVLRFSLDKDADREKILKALMNTETIDNHSLEREDINLLRDYYENHHSTAIRYLTKKLMNENQPLNENIIKKAHEILM